MRTTYVQPPNMKGKKFHAFRCGCCWARNVLDEERERIAWREAMDEVAANQQRLGKEFEEVLFDNLWELYAR